jgi:hypothetical protein
MTVLSTSSQSMAIADEGRRTDTGMAVDEIGLESSGHGSPDIMVQMGKDVTTLSLLTRTRFVVPGAQWRIETKLTRLCNGHVRISFHVVSAHLHVCLGQRWLTPSLHTRNPITRARFMKHVATPASCVSPPNVFASETLLIYSLPVSFLLSTPS